MKRKYRQTRLICWGWEWRNNWIAYFDQAFAFDWPCTWASSQSSGYIHGTQGLLHPHAILSPPFTEVVKTELATWNYLWGIVVWMRNAFYRLIYLNTWFPVVGSVWRGCTTFRRWSLIGGSTSPGVGFEGLWLQSTSCVWKWQNMISLLPVSAAMPSLSWRTPSLWNCKPK